jgi:uncharacterized membrane protein YhhN
MSYTLLFIALVIAVVDWVAVAKGWRMIEYVAKPATMIALMFWLGFNGGLRGQLLWFAFGLACSLAGDIFLMLPVDMFIPGLLSFLVAHLAYMDGFKTWPPPPSIPALIILVLVVLVVVQLYRRIATGLEANKKASLKAPVLVYSVVISLMLLSALFTLLRPDWIAPSALLAAFGALLFFLSDAILAWDRFVAPIRYGRVMNMAAYHLGQMLLVLGAAMHFLH